ncbi:uncharacterized protein LOC117118098 [Anneissia japonica]|uniref:uncharacterized protein LOC117118098 n=1 Tax=Anneissia japonica TaxID=1529436 RepID=UPI0014256642|nr:uncharacterized protein LOC117118098 [Anneissia japonica]XP_033118486.1 uncharacterized protein LOC117118098 [Anneissia japonica]
MSDSQACSYFLSTGLMTLIAIASAVFAGLASTDAGVDLGIYENKTEELSDLYSIEATPADWAFSIWGVIFLFEILWIAYALSTLCRSNEEGPVYSVAPVLPPGFTLLYSVNQVLLVGWLFLWDRQYISYSCLDLFFIFVTGALCLWINYRRVNEYKSYMQENLMGDLVANYLLVQNGIALLTTWTFVATLLNGAIALTYEDATGLDDMLSSTIMYIVITFVITLYFVLDVTIWEKHTRYTFAPYIVIIVASLGSLDFDFDFEFDFNVDTSTTIFELVALGLSCVFLICKFFRTCYAAIR